MTGHPSIVDLEHMTLAGYDRCAQSWADEHGAPGYWAEEIARFQTLLPAGRILEIGAGAGRDAKELIKIGYRYVGTDISVGFLNVARRALPGHEFHEQSVYDLSFPGQDPFDGFWASAVLLHIPKHRIDQALQRIKSVVRPGGVGFISLKDGTGEAVEVETVGGNELRRFFAYWSEPEFRSILARNGYTTQHYIYHPRSERTRWHCFLVWTDGGCAP